MSTVREGLGLDFKIRRENKMFGVGVGVVLLNSKHPRKVVLSERKNAHGSGCYSLPGGHLAYGESYIDCAKRELLEETGITDAHSFRVGSLVNTYHPDGNYHYLTCFIICETSQEPKVLEPEKNGPWGYYPWPLMDGSNAKYLPNNHDGNGNQNSNSNNNNNHNNHKETQLDNNIDKNTNDVNNVNDNNNNDDDYYRNREYDYFPKPVFHCLRHAISEGFNPFTNNEGAGNIPNSTSAPKEFLT